MKPLFLASLLVATSAAAEMAVPDQLEFEVAPADAPADSGYTWREAMNVCRENGMVLPTLEQLAAVYCHADLPEKPLSPRFPQSDKGCQQAGTSSSFGRFTEGGRYWTSSKYHDSIMQFIDFADGSSGYQGKDERLHVRCIVPDQTARMSAQTATPYDINDLDQAAFDRIVGTIIDIYQPELKEKGGVFRVKKFWDDEEETARSWFIEEYDRQTGLIRQVREVELIGGLARQPMLDRDAFAMVVCHEIGHHLGGAPRFLGYSAEAQADYFAAAKCMKRFLATTPDEPAAAAPVPQELERECAAAYPGDQERAICHRNLRAAETLARWFAHSRETTLPDLSSRDPTRRESTLDRGYPNPQCRLDTMVAGALCTVAAEEPFSDDAADVGACTRDNGHERGARPRCWFSPESESRPSAIN